MVDEGRGRGAPHGVLLAVVVGLAVAGTMMLGDQGEAISEAIAGILSPTGLLLLPILLLLIIGFLSSDRGSALFSGGEPNSIHRLGGSPVGIALLLLFLLLLLYSRVSLFGSGDDDSSE